jgi:iron complex outermembrane receptor protein
VYGAGYAVWHWRVGLSAPRVAGVRVDPVLSIENLFDRRYASSLVVNATRNRFFEPGLPRRVSLVVQVRWE